jgi:YHS domain-containing protein
MNAKKEQLIIMSLLAGLLVVGMVLVYGCKKSEPTPSETSTGTMEGHEGHEHAAVQAKPEAETASTTEQTTCPVMEGNKINKAIFTEYKGKKVYFCCPECKPKFEAEPEKYIAKLPQFKDQK